MGVQLELVPVTSQNRIPYLLTGKVDMVISLFAVTPERALQVDFSIPYAAPRTVITALKDSKPIKSLDDLKGMTVGVPRGTIPDLFLTAKAIPGLRILRFDDEATSIQALQSGQIDALGSSNTALRVINRGGRRPSLRGQVQPHREPFRDRSAARRRPVAALAERDDLRHEDEWRAGRDLDQVDRRANRPAAGVLAMPDPRRDCRITRITTYVVGMRWRNCVFAVVETDDGISGVGEGSLEYQPQAVAAAIEQLADRYAVGCSAFAIERLLNDVLRNEFMRGPIINSALAAIEMAMWDIVGQALDRPVYDLLGGRVHDDLPAYANAWYGQGASPAEIAAAAKQVAARGYRGMKFDPFEDAGRDPDQAAIGRAQAITMAVREAVGPEVDLLIDAHGRFSPGAAVAVAQALEPANLFWFEEPCDPDNAASLAAVGRAMRTRLATGERCTSRFLVPNLLETHEVDVLQPDLIHVGGILEAKKIAAMADAYYVPVSFHNPFGPVATAAAVQLDACTTNIIMQESFCEYDVPWRFDLVEHAPCPVGGRYEIGTRAGLGVGAFRARGRPRAPVRPGRLPAAVHAAMVLEVLTRGNAVARRP